MASIYNGLKRRVKLVSKRYSTRYLDLYEERCQFKNKKGGTVIDIISIDAVKNIFSLTLH